MAEDTKRELIGAGRRLLSAAPDLFAAGIFLWCWLSPLAWRKTLVAELMLVMLVEFLVIHSGPFLGMVVLSETMTRAKRLRLLGALGAVYLLFAGAFSFAFENWGPLLLFAWLIGAKIVTIVSGRAGVGSDEAARRQTFYWGVSAAFWLLAVFATLFLPVPELGVTRHGHFYGVPGTGEWVSHPNMVIAAGFLYFAALGLTKLFEQLRWWAPRPQSG